MAKKSAAANTDTRAKIERDMDEAIGSAPISNVVTPDGTTVRVYDAPKSVEDFHGMLHTVMDTHSLGVAVSLVESMKSNHPDVWKTVKERRPEFEDEKSGFATGYIAGLGACLAIITEAMQIGASSVTAVHDDPASDPETKMKALLSNFGEGLALAAAAKAMIGYTVRAYKLSEKTKHPATQSGLPMYDKIVDVFAHTQLMPLAEKIVALRPAAPKGATIH